MDGEEGKVEGEDAEEEQGHMEAEEEWQEQVGEGVVQDMTLSHEPNHSARF